MDPNTSHPFEFPTVEQALKSKRRRTGKVARLPKDIRDQVNVLLCNGIPHEQIIVQLGEHGKHLNKDNIINWEKGGYREWLQDQLWLDGMFSRLEFAEDLLGDPENPKIREAGLLIAVKQMYDLLRNFDPATFLKQLAEEPGNYSRILNALSKLAEVGLRYDRERNEGTRSAAREGKHAKSAAGLTDTMLRQYEHEFKLLRRPASRSSRNQQSQESLREVSAALDQSKSEEKISQESPSEAKRA